MGILNNLAQTFCVLALVSILYIRTSDKDAREQPDFIIYITVTPIVLAVILTAISAIAKIWG